MAKKQDVLLKLTHQERVTLANLLRQDAACQKVDWNFGLLTKVADEVAPPTPPSADELADALNKLIEATTGILPKVGGPPSPAEDTLNDVLQKSHQLLELFLDSKTDSF